MSVSHRQCLSREGMELASYYAAVLLSVMRSTFHLALTSLVKIYFCIDFD